MYKFLIGFVFLSLLSFSAYAQKKNKKTASSSGSETVVTDKRDAFSGKSKKGPNIAVDGGGSKNKAKSYKHSISNKRVKRKNLKNQEEFSSKKRRYKSSNKKQKGNSNGGGKSRGGRKAGK